MVTHAFLGFNFWIGTFVHWVYWFQRPFPMQLASESRRESVVLLCISPLTMDTESVDTHCTEYKKTNGTRAY